MKFFWKSIIFKSFLPPSLPISGNWYLAVSGFHFNQPHKSCSVECWMYNNEDFGPYFGYFHCGYKVSKWSNSDYILNEICYERSIPKSIFRYLSFTEYWKLRVLFPVLYPKIVHLALNLFDLNVEKFMEPRHPIELVALTVTNAINVVDLESWKSFLEVQPLSRISNSNATIFAKVEHPNVNQIVWEILINV